MGNIEPSCFGCVSHRHFSLDHQTGFSTPLSKLDQIINLTLEDSQNINDLICFEIRDLTYLCNISTREFKALPPTGPGFPIHLHRNICSFSVLGFDPVTEQHKVMKTCVLNALNHSGEVITANKIPTLGTSSWRKTGSSTIEFPLADSVCFNRAIDSLTLDLMSNKILVVFDVGAEKFRTIRFPDGALNQVHRPEVDTIHRPSDSVRL